MKINTKYSLNERVWKIQQNHEQKFIKCLACGGSGNVTLLDKKSHTCPECYGRCGRNERLPIKWLVIGELTIGRISAKIENIKPDGMFDNVGYYAEGNTTEEYEYMCYETGIGSGSIHEQDSLFSNKEEAQNECDIRNIPTEAELGIE